jgi:hypothetical protein
MEQVEMRRRPVISRYRRELSAVSSSAIGDLTSGQGRLNRTRIQDFSEQTAIYTWYYGVSPYLIEE